MVGRIFSRCSVAHSGLQGGLLLPLLLQLQ
jgi:hypothetical protein